MVKINYAWVQLLLLLLVISYAVALVCGITVPAQNKAEFAAVFAVILTLLNVDKLKESISKAVTPGESSADEATKVQHQAGFVRLPALLLIGFMLVLGACVSGQITVQTDCGTTNGKSQTASHKDTDQNPVNTSAAIPVQVGATPTGTTSVNPLPK